MCVGVRFANRHILVVVIIIIIIIKVLVQQAALMLSSLTSSFFLNENSSISLRFFILYVVPVLVDEALVGLAARVPSLSGWSVSPSLGTAMAVIFFVVIAVASGGCGCRGVRSVIYAWRALVRATRRASNACLPLHNFRLTQRQHHITT
jgi:hypothetical protein